MVEAVFLLGPNEWDGGYRPPTPVWLQHVLEPVPDKFTPKHLRMAAAHRINVESGGAVKGVVMDPKEQKKGEDDAAFFARLEKEEKITSYFFALPLNAKLVGSIFEGGMLTRDFQWGKKPRILLFIEEGFAEQDDHGNWTFNEPGERTHYLESLANRAHHVQPCRNIEDMVDLVVEWATA